MIVLVSRPGVFLIPYEFGHLGNVKRVVQLSFVSYDVFFSSFPVAYRAINPLKDAIVVLRGHYTEHQGENLAVFEVFCVA